MTAVAQTRSERIENELRALPATPGVYLFRGSDDAVLYVGKAKSLRHRVRSYFQGATGQAPKTGALLQEIHDLEYIVTRTEVEALILENSLIKKERPRCATGCAT